MTNGVAEARGVFVKVGVIVSVSVFDGVVVNVR
jgi:hypothetical protein